MGNLRVKYNVIGYHVQRTMTGGYTVGARRAGGPARHADAVNYGRQVVRLVAGWSSYALITYVTGKQVQHTAACG